MQILKFATVLLVVGSGLAGAGTANAQTTYAAGAALVLDESSLRREVHPFQDPMYVTHQFGNDLLQLEDVKELCVASEKTLGELDEDPPPDQCVPPNGACTTSDQCCEEAPVCLDDPDTPDTGLVCLPPPAECVPLLGACSSSAECCKEAPVCFDTGLVPGLDDIGFACLFFD